LEELRKITKNLGTVSVTVKTNSSRMQDSSATASANLYDKREIVGERHAKGRGKKKERVKDRRNRQENCQHFGKHKHAIFAGTVIF
jgi:hypothetical protein